MMEAYFDRVEFQTRLRTAIFQLVKDKPGLNSIQIHAVVAKEIYCTVRQVRNAVTRLRDNKHIHNEGTHKCAQYVQVQDVQVDAVVRTTILAADAKPLKSAAIPSRPLSHAEYWLHMLGGVVPLKIRSTWVAK